MLSSNWHTYLVVSSDYFPKYWKFSQITMTPQEGRDPTLVNENFRDFNSKRWEKCLPIEELWINFQQDGKESLHPFEQTSQLFAWLSLQLPFYDRTCDYLGKGTLYYCPSLPRLIYHFLTRTSHFIVTTVYGEMTYNEQTSKQTNP